MASARTALITGGSSGLGYDVAKALIADCGWTTSSEDKRLQALSDPRLATVDVTDYAALSAAFEHAFEQQHSLDFVFANAGIVSAQDFYQPADPSSEPSHKTLEIDLHAVVHTSYLAHRFFAQAHNKAARKDLNPKHGVIGIVRSIASHLWKNDRVKVNAVCPGLMRTKILPENVWQAFPEASLTPVGKMVDVVKMLLEGDEYVGETVEVFGGKHWFRKQYEYCEPGMAALMAVTDDL